ncbi:MAG TPA: hypothetical protein PKZ84_22460 [Anaerolineae bacterium]|nr:hypothetical protein [Anaerolineae bacterium]HQI87248.1 hypothetical protein [Anaerolineae bacterium]
MSLLDNIKDEMSGLEQLIAKIPGYKGYKEKELRREADKLLRDHIVGRMRTVKTQLDGLQQDLIGAGKFDLLDETGSAATQIQTFIDRVRTAAYGYGGLFDAVKVKEDDLDRVYEFDSALLGYADRIENAIGNARAGVEGEEARSLILMVRDLAREANTTFDGRQDVLRNTASTGV